jgi:hypothetical protein
VEKKKNCRGGTTNTHATSVVAMAALSLSTQSVAHLMSMSAPIGSAATVIDPASDFPTEGTVSATRPVRYFSVFLSEPALVVLQMQEANTASRCALFLSCTTSKPNANSASWRLTSPEPIKQIVLHPLDPAYRVGVLMIGVHYLETSGQSNFQLRAQVSRDFFAMWLRTGEVPRASVTVAGGRASSSLASAREDTREALHGSHESAGPAKALRSTLHGLLSSAADAPTESLPSSGARGPTRGSLFTSLYIGDWHGNHREGLGFQYYAAPDPTAGGCVWQGVVQADDSEGGTAFATGNGDDKENAASHSRLSAASCSFTHQSTSFSSMEEATALSCNAVAGPLLLLRAFSERHNLPWSAWSIPDTLTPEELAKLCFGHSFRLAQSNRLSGRAVTRASKPEEGAVVEAEEAAFSSTSARPDSPQKLGFHSSSTAPSLPPSPPVASLATAVEGLSVLGSVIDRLLLAEIRDAELEQWSVLPVQPGVEVYAGEWVANTKDGRGFYQWLDRSYVGEWVGGRRWGFGLLRRKDGGWYRGQWERHVPHGSGEARLMPENLLYKGEWRNGCRSGQGCLTYPDGTAVHGTWDADRLLPQVHAVYADGSTYDGVWGADACREGEGTWTDTSGCQHIHVWSHDTRVGEGKEVYPNGVVLEGTWQDDKLISGVFVFPNGDRYVGDMDAEKHVRDGTGTCTSADGSCTYTGSWSNDKRAGYGVFTRSQRSLTTTVGRSAVSDADGATAATAATAATTAAEPAVTVERYEGEWRDDMRSGAGHEEKGEEVYDGNFDGDCRNGTGRQRNTRTGSFYNGHWKAGHRSGAGCYYSATKDTSYEGVFLHDRLTGTGTATKGASQEQYRGLWLDGVEQGHGSLRLANGDTLHGVWQRGQPKPDAAVEYIDAPEKGAQHDSRYVGGWRDGARHGHGTQVFRDGSVYEGAWVDNRQHGRGRRTSASGESVECEWVRGSIAPGCVADVRFADGAVYAGQVNAAGVPHGIGVLTYPDGTVFDGHFIDGIYQL